MRKILFSCAVLTTLFTSCKKNDDNNGVNGSSVLTTGKWQITASTSVIEYPAPFGNQNVDLMQIVPSCQLDNYFIFNTNGSITSDEGATRCNSNDPQQTTSGTWQLLNNNTQLKLDAGTAGVFTADVLVMNSSTMQIRYVTYVNGPKATTTTTYTHSN